MPSMALTAMAGTVGGSSTPDVGFVRRQHLAPQHPAQDQRPHEQRAAGQLSTHRIGHFLRDASAACRIE